MADPLWIGLVGVRLAHYASLTCLFGAALFPIYALGSGTRADGLLPRTLPILAWSALVTTVAWFLVTVANMSGEATVLVDGDILGSTLTTTAFGHLALVRLLLALLAVALVSLRSRPILLALAAGLLLASLSRTGHAAMSAGMAGLGSMAADGLHLLAAGAWIGGLIPLLVLTQRPQTIAPLALGTVLQRFSHVGYGAVGTLVVTGLINSFRLVGSASHLTTTPYGRLLILKITLFLGMLSLAGLNRLWISPALQSPALGSDPALWLNRLKRQIFGEQMLALLILAVVSVLGAIEPAV